MILTSFQIMPFGFKQVAIPLAECRISLQSVSAGKRSQIRSESNCVTDVIRCLAAKCANTWRN